MHSLYVVQHPISFLHKATLKSNTKFNFTNVNGEDAREESFGITLAPTIPKLIDSRCSHRTEKPFCWFLPDKILNLHFQKKKKKKFFFFWQLSTRPHCMLEFELVGVQTKVRCFESIPFHFSFLLHSFYFNVEEKTCDKSRLKREKRI